MLENEELTCKEYIHFVPAMPSVEAEWLSGIIENPREAADLIGYAEFLGFFMISDICDGA